MKRKRRSVHSTHRTPAFATCGRCAAAGGRGPACPAHTPLAVAATSHGAWGPSAGPQQRRDRDREHVADVEHRVVQREQCARAPRRPPRPAPRRPRTASPLDRPGSAGTPPRARRAGSATRRARPGSPRPSAGPPARPRGRPRWCTSHGVSSAAPPRPAAAQVTASPTPASPARSTPAPMNVSAVEHQREQGRHAEGEPVGGQRDRAPMPRRSACVRSPGRRRAGHGRRRRRSGRPRRCGPGRACGPRSPPRRWPPAPVPRRRRPSSAPSPGHPHRPARGRRWPSPRRARRPRPRPSRPPRWPRRIRRRGTTCGSAADSPASPNRLTPATARAARYSGAAATPASTITATPSVSTTRTSVRHDQHAPAVPPVEQRPGEGTDQRVGQQQHREPAGDREGGRPRARG